MCLETVVSWLDMTVSCLDIIVSCLDTTFLLYANIQKKRVCYYWICLNVKSGQSSCSTPS